MIDAHPHLSGIASYTPGASPEEIRRTYGLSHVEKLASNENPFGPSPKGRDSAIAALASANIYNDGGMALRQALAQFHNVRPESITVHNGSDAIIHQVLRTFLLPGETAVSSMGTFVSFSIATRSVGSEPRLVPLTSDYRYDVEALVGAIDTTTKIVYIANPNNPTGTMLTRDEVTFVVDNVPQNVLIVLDEAYVEYARHIRPHDYVDGTTIVAPNVLTLRTFSKAYGLAALRVGYAVGHPDVVRWLLKTKLPFDPNGPACAAAIAALGDDDFVDRTVRTNAEGLRIITDALDDAGYRYAQSAANFVMIDCGTQQRATSLNEELLHRGFIARPLLGFGLPHCLRISTGLDDQNRRLAQILHELAPAHVG